MVASSTISPPLSKSLRFEGLTLTVGDVEKSIAFYEGKLGLEIEMRSLPAFALVRAGNGTIGLLSVVESRKEGAADLTLAQKLSVHVEFSTDELDALYEELKARGVTFQTPPHDEPWERSMTALDPDGYAVEIAQGHRGRNQTKKP